MPGRGVNPSVAGPAKATRRMRLRVHCLLHRRGAQWLIRFRPMWHCRGGGQPPHDALRVGTPASLPQPARAGPALVRRAADARVLAHVHWQPAPHTRPTLLCLHGLEGSSEAHYMRGLASKAWARGWNAVLLNQRNCGGTEHLSAGLYHSGLTADPRAVIAQLVAVDGLQAIAVVGYSLGGNLTVKLAGEYGTAAPAALRACAAVSPTIDLTCCVDALERPGNRVYQWHFVRSLKARMRRKARRFPGGSTSPLCPASAPSAPSTMPTRPRITASRAPPTTTTGRARCGSRTASASRR